MALLLKNGHVVDPQTHTGMRFDVKIDGDTIVEVGENLSTDGCEVIDLAGKYLVPGLVDMHVHLREPGYEHKGTIESETRAAVKGGFTGVCSMPNTDVYPAGACSKGLKGEIIAEMGDMVAHGAVAFTDDGRGIQGAGMMRRCMDYGKMFNKTFLSHCQDEDLVGDGQVNEGVVSTRLGLLGWPAEGEELQIARDIALARLTGAKLHIQHISTARGLELVRAAKAEGLPVTCEVTPHHLFLTEDALDGTYDTRLKMNPPLRTVADTEALIQGVIDGTVDAIATDHAPHAEWEKAREFELAPFGTTGIECALGLVLTNLVKTEKIDLGRMVELMAVKPREILGLDPVKVEVGSIADLTVIDPEAIWTVGAEGYESKAVNCAFEGTELTGCASYVFVAGVCKLADGVVC